MSDIMEKRQKKTRKLTANTDAFGAAAAFLLLAKEKMDKDTYKNFTTILSDPKWSGDDMKVKEIFTLLQGQDFLLEMLYEISGLHPAQFVLKRTEREEEQEGKGLRIEDFTSIASRLGNEISFVQDGERSVVGWIQKPFLYRGVKFTVKESSEVLGSLNICYCVGDGMEVVSEFVIGEKNLLRKNLEKFISCSPCNGLDLVDHREEFDRFSNYPDGTVLFYPRKMERFGVLFTNSSNRKAVRVCGCWRYKIGGRRYCTKCQKKGSTYLSNTRKKDFVRFRLDHELEPLETDGEDEKTRIGEDEFLDLEIIKLLKKGFESGQLNEEMKFIRYTKEQIICVNSGSKFAVNNFTKLPLTLQASLADYFRKGEGFGGRWVKTDCGQFFIFDGTVVRPSNETVKRYLRKYEYGPGFPNAPIKIFFIMAEGIGLRDSRITVGCDGVHGKQGFVQVRLNQMTFLVGGHNYGVSSQFFEDMKKQLLDAYNNESEEDRKSVFANALSGMNFVENKELQEIRFAKEVNQFGISVQGFVKYSKKPVIVTSVLNYFFDSNKTRNEAGYMMRSTLCYLHKSICLGKKSGVKTCETMEIDAMNSDSCTATMSDWNQNGKKLESQEDFEFPYLMDVAVLDENGKGDVITVALLNDGDHLEKETKRSLFSSTGRAEDPNLIFWPVYIDEKLHRILSVGGIKSECGSYKWMPVTKRVFERIYMYDSQYPLDRRFSKIKRSHIYCSGRDNMKTSFAAVFFSEKTEIAITHYLVSKFGTVEKKEEFEELEKTHRLRFVEIMGTRTCYRFFRRMKNKVLLKTEASDVDTKMIEEDLDFLIQIYRNMKSNKKFSLEKNCVRTDVLKKWIRDARSFLYLKKRRKRYIPYSSSSTNPIEQIFVGIRSDDNGRNFANADYPRRLIKISLRKATRELGKKRNQNNNFFEAITHPDVLFEEENMEVFSKFKEEEDKRMVEFMERKIKNCFRLASSKELKIHRENLERSTFGYIVGYLVKSATRTLRSTNRPGAAIDLLRIFSKEGKNLEPVFLEDVMKNDSKLVEPKEEAIDLFSDLDIFVIVNAGPVAATSSLTVLEEMFKRSIIEKFRDPFRLFWRKFYGEKDSQDKLNFERGFKVLVETYCRERLWGILGAFEIGTKKDDRAHRDKSYFSYSKDKKKTKKTKKTKKRPKKRKKKRQKKKRGSNLNNVSPPSVAMRPQQVEREKNEKEKGIIIPPPPYSNKN